MPRPGPFLAAPALLLATAAAAEPFTFVALGDAPYGEPAEVCPAYEALIGAINARAPGLVIHVGDIKSGATPCSDELLGAQLGFMRDFAAPVLYTPGDNEWTDCHREAAGGFDPLDRLAHLRATFFARPETLGGEVLPVESQAAAGFPENARLTVNGLAFVTAHVVGSNNNFEPRDMAAIEEFMARDAANVAWLRESFAAAADAPALVLALQADMSSSTGTPSGTAPGCGTRASHASARRWWRRRRPSASPSSSSTATATCSARCAPFPTPRPTSWPSRCPARTTCTPSRSPPTSRPRASSRWRWSGTQP